MVGGISDTFRLSNGVDIPCLGLGTFQTPPGATTEQSVRWAMEMGYRHVDTAAVYANEAGVGRAIRESNVPREQVFVTTKLWNDDIRGGYDACLRAFDRSLHELGFDYVDLYLVHWPVKGKYKEAWRAMETIYEQKRARAIGVSNFLVHHLQDLMANARIVPMANQIEWHPHLLQKPLMEFCRQHRIQLEAWAPLMQGQIFNIPGFQELAAKYKKTVGQIVLRWNLQHGVVTIPKSVHRERLMENCQLYDFELSAEDVARIDALDRNRRIGPDPDNFAF